MAVRAIFRHIRQNSPQNAAATTARLLGAIDGLNFLPQRFDVPRLGLICSRQVWSMPVRPYLVRYRIDETRKVAFVLRVRHGARRDS
jgi:plasmid stabilization system protein ParE